MKIFSHLTANEEKLKPFDFKRELSMQAYLVENEDLLSLDAPYTDVEIIDDEVSVTGASEHNRKDGRIDLLITYSQEYIGIVEIKLGEINISHLDQIERYIKSRRDILKKHPNIIPQEITSEPKWIGVLVGSSIARELAEKISKEYKFNPNDTNSDHQKTEEIPIAALTIKRFRSENGNIYVATESHFNPRNANRDYTQYSFEGEKYGKGKLVLAVIKKYVSREPSTSYAELREIFPNDCQGSQGVFVTKSEAEAIYEKGGRKRHFINADEIIQLSDSKIAVSNQWGVKNIGNFIDRAKAKGFAIE